MNKTQETPSAKGNSTPARKTSIGKSLAIGCAGLLLVGLFLVYPFFRAERIKDNESIMQDISLGIGHALVEANIQYDHFDVEISTGDENEIKGSVTHPKKLEGIDGGKVLTPLTGSLVIHRTKDGWTVRGTEDLSDIVIVKKGAVTSFGPGT